MKSSKKTENKSWWVIGGILVIFIIFLSLGQVKQKEKLTSSVAPGKTKEGEANRSSNYTPGYQKGVPQVALSPNREAGKIKINNSPKAIKSIQLDVSTPLKKQIVGILEKTLGEMGYLLLISNQEKITNELTLPDSAAAAGSFSSGCTKYGFRWDATKGVIEVFFFIDKPEEVCSADKFMVPVINAIGQAKGQIFEWWKNGLEEVSKKQGREILITDFPLIVR